MLFDIKNDDENDHDFRLVLIGETILSEAEDHPAFCNWLLKFLDQRIEDETDRSLLQLTPYPKSQVPRLVLLPPSND
jgi:hypothetical protein